MKRFGLIIAILTAYFPGAAASVKYSQQEYILMWKEVAIRQMNNYRIPASITLAQGILESGNGNSDLAIQANNHFGIKCHDWKGETFYKDDDQQNECFRKYSAGDDSFEDHSVFLTGKTRYSALFKLGLTDYRSWAQGLKDAGYATNPKYPQLLIDLIEKLKLNEFDAQSVVGNKTITEEAEKALVTTLMANKHEVLVHKNKIRYIVAKKGDTYYRISKEFQLGLWQLYKYNEFGEKKDYLVEGDVIYLEPKKRKARLESSIEIKELMSLRELAQKEGIKVQRLMKMNEIESPDQKLDKGKKIRLR